MVYAIFFCAGLVVGLILAAPIIVLFWMGAHKAAQVKAQSDLITAQAQAMNARKRVDQSLEKLRAGYPEMTREQEEIARDTLEKTFISRYQQPPPTTQKPTPVSKD